MSAIYTVFSLLRIPLAFMVPHWDAGVLGIAWLITVSCTLRAIRSWAGPRAARGSAGSRASSTATCRRPTRGAAWRRA